MSDPITKSIKENIWMKIGLAFIMSLILMIPVVQIEDIIKERHVFGQVAKREVAEKWSKSQVAGAVVLSVPVVQKLKDKNDKGKAIISDHHTQIHFLPKDLKIKADTKTMIRYRGLYKVPLYETKLSFSGYFEDVSSRILEMKETQAIWNKAVLSLGIKEVRGLKNVEMKWNDNIITEDVGEMPSGLLNNSINGNIIPDKNLNGIGAGNFFIEVTLRGSEALEFYPFGQTTTVDMTSNWGSPSFNGAYLPENHEIGNKKFHAQWKVLGLTRSLPKHWEGDRSFTVEMEESQFGVDLHMPLQNYQLNTRSVKYSLLFILLTFATMFFVEIVYKIRFHPMHYGMTGAGLILFYLLLLSISEHIGFGWAYCVAGVSTVVTISMYVLGVTKLKKSAAIVLVQLSLLYGFLFVLLQQEDFALVSGAAGLWLILVIIMYVTRGVDWFDLNLSEPKKEVQS